MIGDFGQRPARRAPGRLRPPPWIIPLVLLAMLGGFVLESQRSGRSWLPWAAPARDARGTVQGSLQGSAHALWGWPRVIDGDTIRLGDVRVRLEGIDAPETEQTCRKPNGLIWSCGRDATQALSDRIGWRPVRCEGTGFDMYHRLLAHCFQQDEDLNRWMIANGWAVVYRQYSSAYLNEEAAARRGRLGVWGGEFALPWEWRHGHATPGG